MIWLVLIVVVLIFFHEQFWEYVGGFGGIIGVVLVVWLVSPLFCFHFDYWHVTGFLCKIWSWLGILVVLLKG